MATDKNRLEGEVAEESQSQEIDVERLLLGLLRSLVAEQGGTREGAGEPTRESNR